MLQSQNCSQKPCISKKFKRCPIPLSISIFETTTLRSHLQNKNNRLTSSQILSRNYNYSKLFLAQIPFAFPHESTENVTILSFHIYQFPGKKRQQEQRERERRGEKLHKFAKLDRNLYIDRWYNVVHGDWLIDKVIEPRPKGVARGCWRRGGRASVTIPSPEFRGIISRIFVSSVDDEHPLPRLSFTTEEPEELSRGNFHRLIFDLEINGTSSDCFC